MNDQRSVESSLPAGLYAVVMPTWVAGFIVTDGRIGRADCAPILWRRLAFWQRRATRVHTRAGVLPSRRSVPTAERPK